MAKVLYWAHLQGAIDKSFDCAEESDIRNIAPPQEPAPGRLTQAAGIDCRCGRHSSLQW
ncbi:MULTISPECIES: hypothetical protein [Mesorhizobium]|uniref:hypothetical protein n=1 Tax=Mesorhizobium TaxID=68287 RepID=UPI0014823678|nr:MULTISPECIES: hypothetical protein [Mesorhizobium]